MSKLLPSSVIHIQTASRPRIPICSVRKHNHTIPRPNRLRRNFPQLKHSRLKQFPRDRLKFLLEVVPKRPKLFRKIWRRLWNIRHQKNPVGKISSLYPSTLQATFPVVENSTHRARPEMVKSKYICVIGSKVCAASHVTFPSTRSCEPTRISIGPPMTLGQIRVQSLRILKSTIH